MNSTGVFFTARIKLTLWYVGAVLFVSLMFSAIIYAGVSRNIEESFARAELRLRNAPAPGQQMLLKQIAEQQRFQQATASSEHELLHQFFLDELSASKQKVLIQLGFANALILLAATIVSYVLAGKTLQPLEESMLEQKRFIADASHELRTPLTSLKTAIEVSLRNSKLSTDARELLEANLSDVNALHELITSLLQLASQERKSVIKQLVDVHEVISKAVKTIQPLADEKDIHVVKKLKHQQILASESGLTELFTILLENAVKYNKQGGKIWVSAVVQNRKLVVRVRDTGIGINTKYIPHIFDRFYRIDASRTVSQRPGFGLGLSVAKQIAENHKGCITVKSEIGSGTTFTVILPL